MAGRIVRLVCITLMSFWITTKMVALMPLLAIPLVGATVLYMINEIKEIKYANKSKNKSKRNKKVTKSKS